MLTGELKNKVDSLWEIFWTGGLTNPLDVIEQMTYLMFIHDLDTIDNLRAKESAMLAFSVILKSRQSSMESVSVQIFMGTIPPDVVVVLHQGVFDYYSVLPVRLDMPKL